MTDKQIIIDGVNVNGCAYITYRDSENPICSETGQYCKGYDICYYKQLKRKEQECFELQMTANAYNYLVKLANYRLDKIEDLQQQLDQLKAENEILKEKLVISSNSDKKTLKIIQTLTEIKEIMKKHCRKCKKHKFYYFQLCCTCKYTEILQKISEVQDAN